MRGRSPIEVLLWLVALVAVVVVLVALIHQLP
jgi:hypothetical protein